jgi:hypothetical protein
MIRIISYYEYRVLNTILMLVEELTCPCNVMAVSNALRL